MTRWTLLLFSFVIYVPLRAQVMDTVYSDRPFFIEYRLDSLVSVRKSKDVKFYKDWNNDDLLIREVSYSIDTVDGREQYFNQLTVTALDEKTQYKTERWRIRVNNEKPKGLYNGEYFVSVVYGCCGAEDEFQLYSLKTGRKVASVTFYNSCVAPFNGMYTYRSPNTINYTPPFPKGVTGELTLFYDAERTSPAKSIKIHITTTREVEHIEFTPDIDVLIKEGLQKKYPLLYPKIEKMKAEYFLVLDYFSEGYIVIPFDNGIPLLSSAVVSEPGVKLSFKK